MHMEGHARTWFTRKQKAELWERWKCGKWGACVARVLEERGRCLRSWFSMEELLQPHAGELRRVVLRRPVELTPRKRTFGCGAIWVALGLGCVKTRRRATAIERTFFEIEFGCAKIRPRIQ
jgi:hypothetical protein